MTYAEAVEKARVARDEAYAIAWRNYGNTGDEGYQEALLKANSAYLDAVFMAQKEDACQREELNIHKEEGGQHG